MHETVLQQIEFKNLVENLIDNWPSKKEIQKKFGLVNLQTVLYCERTLEDYCKETLLNSIKQDIMSREFSFAIPCSEALDLIKSYGPILEVGSGSGFWANLLSKIGCDIIATDLDKQSFERKFFDVEIIDGVSAVQKYPNRTVLSCWPDFGLKWPAKMLEYLDQIIYIGDFYGCTACDEFHKKLENEFEKINSYEIPVWDRGFDQLYVYRRLN